MKSRRSGACSTARLALTLVSVSLIAITTASLGVTPVAAWDDGDTAPIKTLIGASTGLSSPNEVALDDNGLMYVPNAFNNTVTVYTANWSDGDTAPIKTLSGASTGLNGPQGVAFDSSGRMYIANAANDSVTVYVANWSNGDTAPIKTLVGGATGLDNPNGLTFDSSNRMYVANTANNSVTVHAADWPDGNTPPIKTLSGANTGLGFPNDVALDDTGQMYVANPFGSRVTVYAADWPDGDTLPIKSLTGANTGLSSPNGVAFDTNGQMYITNTAAGKVTVYGANWSDGNTPPIKTLSGPSTGLNLPKGIAFDASGQMLIPNRNGDSVTVYAGDNNRRRHRPSLRTVALDPAGGSCSGNSSPWTVTQRRSVTLPTAADCTREGYVLLGWTRDPDKTTPENLLHGTMARSGSVTAVWGKLPSQPTNLAVLPDFLCRGCGTALVVWQTPNSDATGFDLSVDGAPVACTPLTLGEWWVCTVTGLTSDRPHTYTLTGSNSYGAGPSSTVTA